MIGIDSGQATVFVKTVLVGWLPVVVVLFSVLPPRRALIVAFLFAWLFLPIAAISLPLFPNYNKMTATCLSAFCAMLVFDTNRILQFKPKWFDLPMVVLCLCPMASSLTNGLGAYDGFSSIFTHTTRWGLPYFLGRIYCNDLEGMRELAIAIFISGLVYVPLCLYEIRMSPQLHAMVYGFHQHSFLQSYRYGGWRPTVFMDHGLMVGMWMTTASLIGIWLWYSGALRRVLGIPITILLPILLITTILTKSAGAIVLLAIGIGLLAITKVTRSHLALTALTLLPVIYILLRSSGLWAGTELVTLVNLASFGDRAESLQFRMTNEVALSAKARSRPVFGWGGWGRSRIRDEFGRGISVTDSLWVITLGVNGFIGLLATIAVIVLAPLLLRYRVAPALWLHPRAAPASVIAAVLALWMVDNTVNALFNPIFVLMAGGLAGLNTAAAASAPSADYRIAGQPRP